MTAPLEISPVEVTTTPEAVLAGAGQIEGRSLGQIAWRRLRRDMVAMAGGTIVIMLVLVAIIGPHLTQSPNTYHQNLINPTFSRPVGAFGGISLAHPLGVEPVSGRDVLSRIVNGAQYSLLIAFLATFLAVSLGVIFGVIAGYFGGWLDAVIARYMDVLLGSMPRLDRERAERLIPIKGTPPSLINVPSGCAFRSRCAYTDLTGGRSTDEVPPLRLTAPGHLSACHLPVGERRGTWAEKIEPNL